MVLNSFSEGFHDMAGVMSGLAAWQRKEQQLEWKAVSGYTDSRVSSRRKTDTGLGASWERDGGCSPRPKFPDLESAFRRGCSRH